MGFSQSINPQVANLAILSSSDFASNKVTFAGTAVSCIISNTGLNPVECQLNGDSSTNFSIAANESICFSSGDVHLSSVAFSSSYSGAGSTTIRLIAGVVA